MMHSLQSLRAPCMAAALAISLAACSDVPSAPTVVTTTLRLQGALPSHAGIMIDVRGVPVGAEFVASTGATLLARRSADQRGWMVLVAGDLTRSPLLTITSSDVASTVRGSVLELADQRGQMLTSALPSVVFSTP